jgi:hypothetical protein
MKHHIAAPLHEAIPGGRFRLTPRAMTKASDFTGEQVACLQRISLSIFTDMSNAGYTLRETLAAIYLSGIAHAVSVLTRDEA